MRTLPQLTLPWSQIPAREVETEVRLAAIDNDVIEAAGISCEEDRTAYRAVLDQLRCTEHLGRFIVAQYPALATTVVVGAATSRDHFLPRGSNSVPTIRIERKPF